MQDQPLPSAVAGVLKVYTAIHGVMSDMAKEGVGKNQKNTQQNFQYRGVDDVMNALAPSLARHGLIIIPHVRTREVTERESRAGGKILHAVLKIDYQFSAAADGSTIMVGPIYGEAMDSGDKSTNKAMATAYKYACTQTFCIPFSGDDPDANTHDLAAMKGAAANDPNFHARAGTTSHTEPKQPGGATVPAPARPSIAPHTPQEVPMAADGRPKLMRPSGDFGYGKKYASTPWGVMHTRDLEWFLAAERTPANIRERIAIELAWRDWETAQLDADRDRQRAADEAGIDQSEKIP